MTLRYGHDGKPAGLDWSVCNDGNPQPEIWTSNGLKAERAPRPQPTEAGRSRIPLEVEAEVVRLYRDEQLSAAATGREAGVTAVTVLEILKRNNVPSRNMAEARALVKARKAND